MDFEIEQKKIVELVDEYEGGRTWGKFTGDVCCRIIKRHVENHLPEQFRAVGPNVYVENNPTEFDILIVNKKDSPKEYTSMYPLDGIHCIIEIKKSGLFGGRKDLLRVTRKIREGFLSVTKLKPEVKCAYLTVKEVAKPKNKSSINYFEETRNGLSPYEAFVLQEHRTKQIVKGEWKRFINYLFPPK